MAFLKLFVAVPVLLAVTNVEGFLGIHRHKAKDTPPAQTLVVLPPKEHQITINLLEELYTFVTGHENDFLTTLEAAESKKKANKALDAFLKVGRGKLTELGTQAKSKNAKLTPETNRAILFQQEINKERTLLNDLSSKLKGKDASVMVTELKQITAPRKKDRLVKILEQYEYLLAAEAKTTINSKDAKDLATTISECAKKGVNGDVASSDVFVEQVSECRKELETAFADLVTKDRDWNEETDKVTEKKEKNKALEAFKTTTGKIVDDEYKILTALNKLAPPNTFMTIHGDIVALCASIQTEITKAEEILKIDSVARYANKRYLRFITLLRGEKKMCDDIALNVPSTTDKWDDNNAKTTAMTAINGFINAQTVERMNILLDMALHDLLLEFNDKKNYYPILKSVERTIDSCAKKAVNAADTPTNAVIHPIASAAAYKKKFAACEGQMKGGFRKAKNAANSAGDASAAKANNIDTQNKLDTLYDEVNTEEDNLLSGMNVPDQIQKTNATYHEFLNEKKTELKNVEQSDASFYTLALKDELDFATEVSDALKVLPFVTATFLSETTKKASEQKGIRLRNALTRYSDGKRYDNDDEASIAKVDEFLKTVPTTLNTVEYTAQLKAGKEKIDKLLTPAATTPTETEKTPPVVPRDDGKDYAELVPGVPESGSTCWKPAGSVLLAAVAACVAFAV